jgi:putative MATE family efflux protein
MEQIDSKQYTRMTKTPVLQLILQLGIPTVVSMLVTNIYNMADTYFVGTIGTSASGATGIVFGLMAILQAFGFMFGHGAGSNISRKLGAGEIDDARMFASTGFFYSIYCGIAVMVLGLLFLDPLCRILGSTDTILPYARIYAFYILLAGPAMTCSCVMNNILRYEGKAVYAMFGLTAGGILNIFGDALFLHLGMGIAGAGLSTTISQYISMFILLLPYLQGKTQSRLGLRYVTHNFSDLTNIISVGMPSMARQSLTSLSTMVLNLCAGGYGDAAVAALSIVARICNFLFCVAIGIGQGFQPISAFNYGAGIYSRVKSAFDIAMIFGTGLMILTAIYGYFNAGSLVALFRDDPAVIEIGTRAMRWQCISLVLLPLAMYGNMLFQSVGIGRTATLLACLRSGICLIPIILIFNALWGLAGLESAQALSDVLSGIITIPFVVSFFRELPPDRPAFRNS